MIGRTIGSLALVAAALAPALATPADVHAQGPRRGADLRRAIIERAADSPRMAALGARQRARISVESLMRARDRLELTDEQLAQLDAIRTEVLERRLAVAAEWAHLRSRMAAGEMERGGIREALEAAREARTQARPNAERMERVMAILSDEQREQLDGWRRRMRAEAMAPRGQRGGRGGGAWRSPSGREGRWGARGGRGMRARIGGGR